MSKELLLVVDAVANEKGVPESVILEAIEAALASAAKKRSSSSAVRGSMSWCRVKLRCARVLTQSFDDIMASGAITLPLHVRAEWRRVRDRAEEAS